MHNYLICTIILLCLVYSRQWSQSQIYRQMNFYWLQQMGQKSEMSNIGFIGGLVYK